MEILITGYYSDMWDNGYCFNNRNSLVHENCYDRLIQLKKSFLTKGVNLVASNDLSKLHLYDAVICHDHPLDKEKLSFLRKFKKPKFLIAEEVPYLLPQNYSSQRILEYDLIFTWNKNFINDVKCKYHYSLFPDIETAKIIRENDIPLSKKCKKVLVASAKKDIHHNSLYPLRSELAKWYNINQPDDFHLYGSKWDRYYFAGNNIFSKFLNWRKLDFIFNGRDSRYKKIYQGKLASKYNFLNRYKFQFCIENGVGYSGYVTEKIFDSLICRNLPIYYPSDIESIDEIIPNNLYIDMRNFKNFTDLNNYLNNIQINEYSDYIERIDRFFIDLPDKLKSNYASDKLVKSILNFLI